MNRFEAGAEALIRRMKASAGVPVTYTRGADSVVIVAWVGTSRAEQLARGAAVGGGGAVVTASERDYLFAAADLVLAGEPVAPRKGDTITETINGTECRFALAPTATEPGWRYSDPTTRRIVRFHTKRIEVK